MDAPLYTLHRGALDDKCSRRYDTTIGRNSTASLARGSTMELAVYVEVHNFMGEHMEAMEDKHTQHKQ